MADHAGEHESIVESVMDKITETFKGPDSSSSDSDNEKDTKSPVTSVKSKIYRLFGREKPVHKVLGGGKCMRNFFVLFIVCIFVENITRLTILIVIVSAPTRG